LLAHAVAAVTIGTVLGLASGAGDTSPETVAVDLEPPPVVPAVQASLPLAPPSPAVAGGQSGSVWHRRMRASRMPVLPAVPSRAREDAEPPLARFVLAAGTVTTRAEGLPIGPAGASSENAGGGEVIAGESELDAPAQLVKTSPLVYPEAARRAGIETDLPVEIVIDTDGRVVSARALRQAGYGLDEAAMGAIRAYRFWPGFRAGRPVRVRMRWTLQFRLR
jgi:TonB family protein